MSVAVWWWRCWWACVSLFGGNVDLSGYKSRYYPTLGIELAAQWAAAGKANAWPKYLGTSAFGAYLQAADNASQRGDVIPEPGFWLSALLAELNSGLAEGEPAPGYQDFAGRVATLAEAALDVSAAQANAPGWAESAWKTYGEPIVATVAGGIADTVAPPESGLRRLLAWAGENPGEAAAAGLGLVALAGLVYTAAPTLLLRGITRGLARG